MAQQERPDLRDLLLVGAQHAMGVDDDLGKAGGTAGQQVFRVVAGPDRRERVHHRRCLVGRLEQAERLRARMLLRVGAEEDRRLVAPGRQRRAVDLGVRRVDQRRRQHVQDAGDLGVVLGQAAIGAGHHAPGPAHVHRGQPEQRGLDRVVRQHDHGPARRAGGRRSAPARSGRPGRAPAGKSRCAIGPRRRARPGRRRRAWSRPSARASRRCSARTAAAVRGCAARSCRRRPAPAPRAVAPAPAHPGKGVASLASLLAMDPVTQCSHRRRPTSGAAATPRIICNRPTAGAPP